jgi:transposase
MRQIDADQEFIMTKKASAEASVRNIRRETRRKYTAEEKIRIVLEDLRGELTIAELYRREGTSENLYYRWSKDFLEACKSRYVGDTKREDQQSGGGKKEGMNWNITK